MDSELSARIMELERLLAAEYGEKPWQPTDPVDALVLTILSQNTNDVNRDRAFACLRERFPTWEAVRDAPLNAVVEAIRPAGLAPTKGPHIQAALRRITAERGKIDLSFLADLPLEEARAWLLDMPGVGLKTAAIVLLFALGRPAFPVDTHVHRVAQRLGLIPAGTSREKAHRLLEEAVPPALYYSFHLNLIEHGRAVCHARRPACQKCILRVGCPWHDTEHNTDSTDYTEHNTDSTDYTDKGVVSVQSAEESVCAAGVVELILLRHGQTFANVEGRWVGREETELTPLGWQQAERTAERLAREVNGLLALYSSPRKRALDTAMVIGRALGCMPIVVDDLREVDFGDMDGLTITEMAERDPDLYARWLDKADSGFTWPGGDRRADFFRRVAATFDALLARHESGTVIVVAHGGTLRACLAHLFPAEMSNWWTYRLDNCGLTRVEVGKDGAQLVALNDVAHLNDDV